MVNGALTLIQLQPTEAVEELLLGPLLDGRPIVMLVNDNRLVKKRREFSGTFLFITPLSVYGGDKKQLLVSLPPHGAEIVNLAKQVKPIMLSRLGINYTLSRALANALNKLTEN